MSRHLRSRIRVLQMGKFYPPERGGMESHVKTLAEGLQEQLEVEVLVSSHDRWTSVEVMDGVPVTRVGRLGQVSSTSINPALLSAVRRSKAELVHLHWPNPMAAVAYLMSGHKGGLCVTYHSDVIKQRLANVFFEPVLDTVLRRADAVLVSSEEYCRTSAVLRRFKEKVRVVPFGIDAKHFEEADGDTVRHVRERPGNGVVLSVGRLVDYKGFDVLIRAVAMTHARLVIAGEGALKPRLESLVQELGIESRVCFAGNASDEELRTLYHAADIFVLASTNRREAFGLVQAEAMAAGLPVINTAIASGARSVSLDEVTGITVPPGDEESLAAAMTKLLNLPAVRQGLGRAARQRAEKFFRPETMVAKTCSIYEEIAAKHELSAVKLISRKNKTLAPALNLNRNKDLYSQGER